ncbi:UDP-N-acetylmuramoyl-L-alanine--D-glutamate ligase [Teredinibacter haidensis]|uniref:UDP-N-acetylmuramoyl-L-alanine--D-glutamate ligase n=1 Tax=Teredinibacter haidensis TaxID=2731755 RepID=UPI0009490171|nr:UDP-N-acetylmuramoyl-L-alanine--D-glutamate ligase [Teredinibacter haidensis]
MSSLLATDRVTIVFGLGMTGVSVARYLSRKKQAFVVVDTRANPPGLNQLKVINSRVEVITGELSEETILLMSNATEIIISPGVSRHIPALKNAIEKGVSVIGDVALFLREAKAPVIGITGSNGKTTVTTIVGEIAEKAGVNVRVGGNIGVPALDILGSDVELYVLELSSFQLESIPSAGLHVACHLNLSEDHMDRYDSLAQYCMAKQRVFWGAKNVVYNLDEKLTQPPITEKVKRFGFGMKIYAEQGDIKYLFSGTNRVLNIDDQPQLAASELKMFGRHNIANALAVMAICDAVGLDRKAVKSVLCEFKGLSHRCQWVAEYRGVTFINDSKATNVGAAIAAIEGMVDDFSEITLIAGGDGKGADFDVFAGTINRHIAQLVLIGRDALLIADKVDGNKVNKVHATTLEDAVQKAFENSRKNSVVLLSPACASFDMFTSFEHRGDKFITAVGALVA